MHINLSRLPVLKFHPKTTEGGSALIRMHLSFERAPKMAFFTTTVENAALGALGLTHLTFLVIDLHKAIDEETFPAAAGTICYTALKDRVVTIDYLHHKLQLSEAGAEVTAPETAGTLSFPTFGHRGPAIVTATGFLVAIREASAPLLSQVVETGVLKVGRTHNDPELDISVESQEKRFG